MRQLLLALVVVSASAPAAFSQGLRAVQPLPGYTCMMLSSPPAASIEQIPQVPVRSAPSVDAPITSILPSVVVVPFPLQATSGFLLAVFDEKHKGWVSAAALKLWSSPYNQKRRCYPSIMSNGSYGFDFH